MGRRDWDRVERERRKRHEKNPGGDRNLKVLADEILRTGKVNSETKKEK